MNLYKRLKEIDQLKDDFISMASHELRTPLTVIKGYVELLLETHGLMPETKDHITKIEVSVKELNHLVGDLLDVSKIQQGRLSIKMEKTNPAEITDQIVSFFSLSVKEKGLNIVFDQSKVKAGQYINIDVNRFKQVLVNLIGNAIKYSDKGDIIIKQYVENKRLYFRISDTGVGMSEEERKKLFEKFYRIRTKETEKIRGTGLGLWITIQIVKQMNGDMSVESIKGVGSHFIVSFPIVS